MASRVSYRKVDAAPCLVWLPTSSLSKRQKTGTVSGATEDSPAVKKADREREIAQHGKLISTRPTKAHQSKKVYNRQNNKNIDIND
jgi:hypothetical protein